MVIRSQRIIIDTGNSNLRYWCGDIVPDQVTPASDANPLVDSGTVITGTSTEYSRGDHQQPQQISTVLPAKDISVDTVGQASTYARSDHQHPIQTVDTVPVSDTVDGSYDTFDSFMKTNGTNQQILLADGTIKPIIYATRADYISTPTQFVMLCTINPFLQNNCIFAEFRVRGRSGFGVLQYHQMTTANGLTGGFYHLQPNFQNCKQEAYTLYYGSGTTRKCDLWVQLPAWSNGVVINYTNGGSVTEPIINILTTPPVDELPTDYTSTITLTPNLQFNN
ncbi:MAG: hypothetical protein EZS28_044075 [Streblomastix strix]|uniref:Uncharacterized protein n=1 Tax=Streblomastix strix TaxID=222440 RepID=A0A5J4TQ29_9EUKA|nr:MAG: hypothetical protein EZS28_044075 [Streblomastix strix]